MRNPIHKRLTKFDTWQSVTFMAALCERMVPNFLVFCQITNQLEQGRVYRNILNLVWESLTVKKAKINFERQLEKLEEIIPNLNDYEIYGVLPAVDACEALSELLHALIAGEYIDYSVKVSNKSLQTVADYLQAQNEHNIPDDILVKNELMQDELDIQWAIYRALVECEKRDIELIYSLKDELSKEQVSNICMIYEQ